MLHIHFKLKVSCPTCMCLCATIVSMCLCASIVSGVFIIDALILEVGLLTEKNLTTFIILVI